MKKSNEPPRGEDAWLAAKKDMDNRNREARARAEEQGAAHAARAARRRQEIARLDSADLPTPPQVNGSRP